MLGDRVGGGERCCPSAVAAVDNRRAPLPKEASRDFDPCLQPLKTPFWCSRRCLFSSSSASPRKKNRSVIAYRRSVDPRLSTLSMPLVPAKHACGRLSSFSLRPTIAAMAAAAVVAAAVALVGPSSANVSRNDRFIEWCSRCRSFSPPESIGGGAAIDSAD